ncbi:MAG: virulence RhuM family protein [Bacteroidales bacterium]|nr:virulence RhuM family protein [Bacteroidales bacterium]
MEQTGEIVLYQPNETIRLEVRLEEETVWLSQAQMSELFQRDRSAITRHINNVFAEGELDEGSNVQILHFNNTPKPVKLYSLDVIISVGYRVKSVVGTRFRQWASKVLKDYLLRGYSVNQRVEQLERKVDNRLAEHDSHLQKLDDQIGFFVRTSLPPVEGVFYDGQIFDAYKFATDLIKSAKDSIILIDNYVDDSVLLMLSKRNADVFATIYTNRFTEQLQLDLNRHNDQYPPIDIRTCRNVHDRFMIIDGADVYHIGASLKDLGKKLFAFSKLTVPAEIILDNINGADNSGVET